MSYILLVFSLISTAQRLVVVVITAIRLLLSLFDVAGLAFIGLSVSILAGSEIATDSISGQVLETLRLDPVQVGFFPLAAIGVAAFALKAVASVLLTLWIGMALARTEVERAGSLFSRTLLSSLDSLEIYTGRQVAHALNGSATVAYSKALNTFSTFLADVFLALLLVVYMLLADAFSTLYLLIYFAGVAILLQLVIGKRIRKLSTISDEASVGTNALAIDVYENIRQIRSRKSRDSLNWDFRALRMQLAVSRAKNAALSLMPRYALEVALALGVLLLVSLQLSGDGLLDAAITAILLAGAFRLSTTLASLQSGWNQLNEFIGQSRWTLNLERHLPLVQESPDSAERELTAPDLQVRQLGYFFPRSNEKVFSSVDFSVPSGGLLLVRGPSGRGKSTLADLLLGLRIASEGSITLDGLQIEEYLRTHPSGVAYVPQHTKIIEGSIARNVSFQESMTEQERARALASIQQAELGSFVSSLEDGLDTRIGPGAHGMSGGQIQRLGLARALYLNPKLLILDEVTSALDETTSLEVTKLINSLKGEMTILVISHKPEKALEYDAEFVL